MTDNEFERTARAWLADSPNVISDRALQFALDEIHNTRQRRLFWPVRRFPRIGNSIRLLVGLTAVVLASVIGLSLLPAGGAGLPVPTPSPTPTASPFPLIEGDLAPMQPGTYVTADPFLARVTFTVPAGWAGHLGGPYYAQLVGAGEVGVSIFDKVYADPCQFEKGFLNPLPGPNVGDLVTALTAMPGINVTNPTDVTFGGYAGKQLTMTAPPNFNGCTTSPEGYAIWQLPLGALYTMSPGQGDWVWILNVEGQRIVIVASAIEGKTAQVKAEVQGILDSIRIAPDPPTASPF